MKKVVIGIFLILGFDCAVVTYSLQSGEFWLTMFLSLATISCLLIYVLMTQTKSGKYATSILRGVYYGRIFKTKNLRVQERFRCQNPECITLGSGITIDHDAEFYPVKIYNGEAFPSKLIIGNNVCIGAYNRFASKECVEIEDDVLFAAYVHITDHSHAYADIDIPVYKQGLIGKGPVKIGKGSWIGLRCSILSGVTIGEHCIIATGAVVTCDIPPYSIAGGVPAKVIKRYDFDKSQWVSVKESL